MVKGDYNTRLRPEQNARPRPGTGWRRAPLPAEGMATWQERRTFLSALLPAAIVSVGVRSSFAAQGRPPEPFPKPPSPEESAPKPDPRVILKENQKDIKKDVARLAELAAELKKEVEKTDSSEVLSLQLVRKTEEIEKLAKHIRSLARG